MSKELEKIFEKFYENEKKLFRELPKNTVKEIFYTGFVECFFFFYYDLPILEDSDPQTTLDDLDREIKAFFEVRK